MGRLQSFSNMGQNKLRVLPLRCQRCAHVGTKKKPVRQYVFNIDLCEPCIEAVRADER